MQNSYSFLVNLESPGFKTKFKIGDGTLFEVAEHWTFLDNRNSDILDNLGHVIVVRQKNHGDRAYSKTLEAYPLEQTEYTTIVKSMSDACYWFSVTYREYDEAFRPNGKGSFEKILCKIIFTPVPSSPDTEQTCTVRRRTSSKKRYNYKPLQNISSSDVKHITMKTALECLLQAVEVNDADMKNQAIDFIVKNFTALKTTDLWQEFCTNHRELKDKILDIIIEHMGNQSERASMVLQETVSMCNIAD